MLGDQPELRIMYIKQRQADRIAEGAANRSVDERTSNDRRRFVGLHLRLGDLLIVIGRTLCDEDGLSLDLIR